MSQTAPSSRTQPEMVYVDAYTGLYHHTADAAGPDPTSYSRPQADLIGFDPCPTCFSASAQGGETDG